MQVDYSIDSKDLETILRFEQINLAKYTFSGNLKGRNYTIRITEYKQGELVKIDTMFYSSQDEYFRMSKDTLNITFITKNKNDELVFELNGNGFSSPKMNYEILNDAFWKAMRFDFNANITDCFDGQKLSLKNYIYKMIDNIYPSLEDFGTLILEEFIILTSVLFISLLKIVVGIKFIFGEPIKPATNMLSGFEYNSNGVPF